MDNDQSHISTQTFGTIPYMPPELLADGRMTRAVDVYSFGVISASSAHIDALSSITSHDTS